VKKIKYLGKTEVNGKTITKRYANSVSGSAYKKVPCDIIVMFNAGFKDIVIQYEEGDRYAEEYRSLMRMTVNLLPDDVRVRLIKRKVR